MLTNNSITYYHKTIENNLPVWNKTVFDKVWVFGTKASQQDTGYIATKIVNVRIPMEQVTDISIFSIGDIIAAGIQDNITKQSDLNGKEFYNVTSITINSFGNNQHIHLGGN